MLNFQTLLREAKLDPRDVRLLRHAKKQSTPGMSQYQAWREHRDVFERYQATQPAKDRKYFQAPYWASFVATPFKETLFVGLYSVSLERERIAAFACPLTGLPVAEGHVDLYETVPLADFQPYEGKLII